MSATSEMVSALNTDRSMTHDGALWELSWRDMTGIRGSDEFYCTSFESTQDPRPKIAESKGDEASKEERMIRSPHLDCDCNCNTSPPPKSFGVANLKTIPRLKTKTFLFFVEMRGTSSDDAGWNDDRLNFCRCCCCCYLPGAARGPASDQRQRPAALTITWCPRRLCPAITARRTTSHAPSP